MPIVQAGAPDLVFVISSAALDPESTQLSREETEISISGRTFVVDTQHQETLVGLHRPSADRGHVGPPLKAARRHPAALDEQEAELDGMRDVCRAVGTARARCSS